MSRMARLPLKREVEDKFGSGCHGIARSPGTSSATDGKRSGEQELYEELANAGCSQGDIKDGHF